MRAIRALLMCAVFATACRDDGKSAVSAADSGRVASVTQRLTGAQDHARREVPADSVLWALAFSAGGDGTHYEVVRDTTQLHAGTVLGRITAAKAVAGDTAIEPTHDLGVCKPFTETLVPSDQNGVGNAVVWLVGVERGPAITRPKRVSLLLDRCRLSPRVQAVAQGSTLLVTSRDAMMSRLRLADTWGTLATRAEIMLNDAGQVVPTTDVAARAGLVEVRDALHPWVRAWLAVSAHPFVAVTDADGDYRFDSVPPGSYTLVVWQEKLGARTRVVQVTTGVETRVSVAY